MKAMIRSELSHCQAAARPGWLVGWLGRWSALNTSTLWHSLGGTVEFLQQTLFGWYSVA